MDSNTKLIVEILLRGFKQIIAQLERLKRGEHEKG